MKKGKIEVLYKRILGIFVEEKITYDEAAAVMERVHHHLWIMVEIKSGIRKEIL